MKVGTVKTVLFLHKGERAGRCKYTQFLPVQLSHSGIRRYCRVSKLPKWRFWSHFDSKELPTGRKKPVVPKT